MTNFDNIFEEFQYSDKAEKSLKEFSNWILSISIGIGALLVTQIKEFDLPKYDFNKIIYLTILICSMLNILVTGYNKYMILKRDTIMSIKYGSLKKLMILSKINNKRPEEIKEEWNKIFAEWANEFNKIKRIGQILNISVVTILITILFIGVFIITVI